MRLTAKHLFLLKTVIHIVAMAPIVYLVLLVLDNAAGGDPVQFIIHYTGMGALNTLAALLMVSPLARKFKQGLLIQTRRLLGLYVFAYASLHIAAFVSLDLLFEWSLFLQELVKRPYIVIGMIGYLILIALSVTSLKSIKRRMGKRWQQLHNLVYLLAILTPIHFYWSVKSEVIEPGIYIVLFSILLLLRVRSTGRLSQFLSRFKLRPNE
ncbi:protein-methionine-sulfoxide reductase heme-binding subunit MsrQ [uncultured Shewanella sp.]|uniref:protein-methionine-sulfoxide reductase heme-binding subunit MsrQ n=1 Tax=Shewanella atlantica TaxID=271099 RepID=UPI002617644D|nr:protein-methionine-sulfoxide reductase heme-binding subunit MsrQ [uncultured Shewanella sp.]